MVDGLRMELASFGRERVERFIREISGALTAIDTKEDTKEWRDEGVRLARLQKMQNAAEAFLRDGFLLALPSPYPERISVDSSDTWNLPSKADRAFFAAQMEAQKAATEYLNELRRVLRAAPERSRGRPKADARGTLARIAYVYRDVFGELPTSTPGGKFWAVAICVLQYERGTPQEDVQKQVRAAIRAIRVT